jgi:protein involved in polysaccharide export with SLBB domain
MRSRSSRALCLGMLALLASAGFTPPVFAQVRADDSSDTPSDRPNQAPEDAVPSEQEKALRVELAGPIDATHYRLGPGDLLSLELSGRTSRIIPLEVDPEGRINVPEVGVVTAGGRTLADVRQDLITRLGRMYKGVRVDLRPVRLRRFKVFIAGQVKSPGAALANGGMRASEVFLGTSGLLPDASHRNIELRRRDGTRLKVDLDAFAYMGRETDNPFLEDGDILVVPPKTGRIFALGAFGRPGEYEFSPGDSLSELIALAGGLLPSAEASGTLVHFVDPVTTESLLVDLPAVVRGVGDAVLGPQDRLYARQPVDFMRPRGVTLVGEVRFPGPYAVNEGVDRISTVLARAGGLTPVAAANRIQIYRPSTNGGQRDIEFERLSRLSRTEMTDAEYQVFKTKLASQQSAFVVSVAQLADPIGHFDVTIRDGDIIVVDRETEAVRVAGEVRRPSLIEYGPGRTAREYIELAGGFSDRAHRSKVRVTHAGSNQTLLLKDVKAIEPGDFIWVPEKSEVSFWSVLKDAITVAGAVATIVILVDNAKRR